MKKIIVVFVLLCLVIGGGFFIMQGDSSRAYTKQFLIADNSNHIFDATFEKGAGTQFSLPFYNPAKPLEDLNYLESLETVEEVVPFYPVFLYTQNDDGITTFTYYENDEMNNKKTIPMPISFMNGEMNEMRLMPVTNYDQFYQVHKNTAEKTFIKEFESESGVYIPSALYEQMTVQENASRLTIQVQVQIPVVAKYDQVSYETNLRTFEITDYTMVDFETVDITLEVQGVFQSQMTSFCRGLNIIVPYEMTQDIYKQVDLLTIELHENEMYWQPNCYFVTCYEGVKRNDFGYEAISRIESIYVEEWDHGGGSAYHYLYIEDDVLINQ